MPQSAYLLLGLTKAQWNIRRWFESVSHLLVQAGSDLDHWPYQRIAITGFLGSFIKLSKMLP